jgi:ATP-binding cassette subfamily C protein
MNKEKAHQLIELLGRKKLISLTHIALFGVVVGLMEMVTVMMVPTLIRFITHEKTLTSKLSELRNILGGLPIDNLNYLLGLFVMIFASKFLISIFYYRVHASFLQQSHFEVVNNLFLRLCGLTYLEYKNENSSDNLKKITIDSYEFNERILLPILVILTETITLTFLLLVIFLYKPLFFFITFSVLVFVFWGYKKIINKRIKMAGENKSYADIKLLELVKDYDAMYKEIKIYRCDSKYLNLFKKFNEISSKSYETLHFFNQVPRLLLEFVAIIAMVSAVFFTVDTNSEEFLPFMSLVVIISFRLLPLANRITNSLNDFSFASETISSFYCDNTPSDCEGPININFDSLNCSNISIKLGDRDIINNMNFEINKNDIVAIVGKSGTGKTTLIDFIMGFVPNSRGQILLNKDAKYKLIDLRPITSYVPQETHIVNGNIYENISLFSGDEIDVERINFLIKKLNLELLSQRLKKSNLGDAGRKISGGERQRIGIARALYSQPQILILDEATGSLDRYNQKVVLDFLKELSPTMTIIFITHRHETLPFANKIIEIINEKNSDNRK